MSPKCFECGGSGRRPCHHCKGTGTSAPVETDKQKGEKKEATPCSHCGGTGEITCHSCGGRGRR